MLLLSMSSFSPSPKTFQFITHNIYLTVFVLGYITDLLYQQYKIRRIHPCYNLTDTVILRQIKMVKFERLKI